MTQELRLKLKAARTKAGLSQTQAAKAWNIPLQTLKNWETDQRTPRGLALTALNQLLDDILSAAPLPSPPPAKQARKRTK